MTKSKVYVAHAFRTPTALIGGELSDRAEQWLAARVFEAIAREFPGDLAAMDEIIIGVARQTSTPSNAARYISLLAEYPQDIPAYTFGMQSASGLAAMAQSCFYIASGAKSLVLSGGTESSSMAPLELHDVRYDFSEEKRNIVDAMDEQMFGSQPYELYGDLTIDEVDRNLCRHYDFSEEAVEAYAAADLARAKEGLDNPLNRKALVPLAFKRGKKEIAVDKDGVSPEGVRVTPYGDGAAACILAGEDAVAKHGLKPLCEAVGFGMAAGDPRVAGVEAFKAVKKALGGMPLSKVGFIATAILTASQGLGLQNALLAAGADAKAINPYGSNLHLGNPQGASGSIAAVAAARAVEAGECEYSLAVACAEGGQTTAALFGKA